MTLNYFCTNSVQRADNGFDGHPYQESIQSKNEIQIYFFKFEIVSLYKHPTHPQAGANMDPCLDKRDRSRPRLLESYEHMIKDLALGITKLLHVTDHKSVLSLLVDFLE